MSYFHIKLFSIFFFSILFCGFFIPHKAYAVNYYICSGDLSNSSDIWNTPDCSSGSNGFTPVSGDTLYITGNIITEYANIEYTVEIGSGASLDMGGGGGIINIVNDVLTIQSGASLILNASGFNVNNATLNNNGTIDISSGRDLLITGSGTFNNGGTINNNGNIIVESDSILDNTHIINNYSTLRNATFSTITNSGTLSSDGTIENEAGATLTNSGNITNNIGSTLSNEGIVNNNASITNDGTLNNINNGNFSNSGTLTNNGTFTNAVGGTLTNSSGTLTNNGTFTNNGTWSRTGGSIVTNSTGITTNNSTTTYSINNASLPYNLSAQTANGATNYNAVLSHTPTSWSATGLPVGLSISTLTGIISGTPTTTSSGTLYVTSTGSSATQAVAFSVTDAVIPTIDIQGEPLSATSTTPFIITFEFSENVTGFAVGDIVVVNASLSSFVAVDGNTYTVSVTPAGAGNITIDVPVNSAQDASANGNAAATQVVVIYISSTGVSVSGSVPSRKNVPTPITPVSPQTNLTPDDTLVCTELISTYIKLGNTNNTEDVRDLQTFLNTYENETLVVDGLYKQIDKDAVKRFQTKYASEILAPWGLTEATGFVYQTTKAKINLIHCGKTKGCLYFTQYHKLGSSGGDVKKIQNFLNLLFGQGTLQETGVFDKKTFDAVSKYQTFYKKTVLEPWKLAKSTGFWYQSTRLSANKLMGCFEGEKRLDNGTLLQ